MKEPIYCDKKKIDEIEFILCGILSVLEHENRLDSGEVLDIYNLIYESIKDLTAIVLKEQTLDDVGITETKKKKLVEDMGEFLVALRHVCNELGRPIDDGLEIRSEKIMPGQESQLLN